eukprot:GHVS01066584.1.p1 GENE.GHVS01066584.1~~GHVS01066584.1.p1  ORF type:complete len:314 (-),score=21.17 GHVS01066584.1:3712-4653(-)
MSSANDADQADDASPSEDDALSSEDDALSRGRGDASSSVRSSDDSGRQPQEDGAPIRHGRSASHTGEGSRPEQHNGRPSAFINAGSALPNGGGTPIVTDFPRADSHIRGWRHPGNDRGGDKGVCGKQPYLHQRTIATVSPTVPQCAEGNVHVIIMLAVAHQWAVSDLEGLKAMSYDFPADCITAQANAVRLLQAISQRSSPASNTIHNDPQRVSFYGAHSPPAPCQPELARTHYEDFFRPARVADPEEDEEETASQGSRPPQHKRETPQEVDDAKITILNPHATYGFLNKPGVHFRTGDNPTKMLRARWSTVH